MYIKQSENNGVIFRAYWSDTIDEQEKEDFCKVKDAVFGGHCAGEFRKKFQENIYGNSLIVIAYAGDIPIGARAFWRNDIDGKECYQPCDTCVLQAFRGKGVFTGMTELALQITGQVPVYNFPNSNSLPGYLKLGWKVVCQYRARLFTPARFKAEHPQNPDRAYCDWWISGRKKKKYIKVGNRYYLVGFLGKKCCYGVLMEVCREDVQDLERVRSGIFFYYSTRETFYNRNMRVLLNVIGRGETPDYIPVWKMDAI